MKPTKEQIDRIYDLVTVNGCREMTKERFNQAVNEILPDAFGLDQLISFGYYVREHPNDTMHENYQSWKKNKNE